MTPEEHDRPQEADEAGWEGVNWWGVAFILFGGWWLLDELGYVTFDWGIVAPVALVIVGLTMLFNRC
ncbi:MAG: DUF5668 domain-containing protein [Candidatus Thermoplasmatota archaeon]|nr:DUF5668 domain-containing protein [Candidatus Thermoplasmatota archaeon]